MTDIEQAAARARKVVEEHPKAKLWWNLHHDIHVESLTEPVENRIRYILTYKPAHERVARLNNLRPVLHPKRLPKTLAEAGRKLAEAHHKRVVTERKWNEAGLKWAEADHRWVAADHKREAYRNQAEAYRKWYKADRKWAEAYYKWNNLLVVHEPKLMKLHREEWPDTTWNGQRQSIFGKETA